MHKFEVGEICEVFTGESSVWVEAEIVTQPMGCKWKHCAQTVRADLYLIDTPDLRNEDTPSGYWTAQENDLRKLRPGNEASTWEACVWKPAGVEA